MMVWFLVDDNLALHQKADQAGNAAMGLWVRAGAWAAGNLTDGFIPSRIAHQIGTRSNINSLLNSGLWSRCDGGFQFHDWADRQPTAEQVRERRDNARKRQARHREKEQGVTRDTHARGRPSPLQDLGSLPHQRAGPAPPPHPATPAKRKPDDTFSAMADCPFHCYENDGYRINGTVCDHIDRSEISANGSAAVREALNEAKARKANR